jgi:hypothetical protein
MAISVVVLVGTAQSWLPDLIERASKLSVNGGFEKGVDLYVHSFYVYPLPLNIMLVAHSSLPRQRSA